MSVFSRLSHLMKTSPTLTASIQSGSLMCVGDVISQKIVEKKEKFDFARNARFGAIGFFMVGPILRTWYGFLERKIVMKSPLQTGVGKVVADQLLMAPVFLANFIAVNSLLQGNSWNKIKTDVSSTYSDVIITNYQLWPAVQMVNFMLVPLQFRVLFVQCVAVLWNCYLSWKTNRIGIVEFKPPK